MVTPERRSIVGRDREIAILRDAIGGALSGDGSSVALVGEAGIGKTRLALEAQTYATRAGFLTLWANCQEHSGAPPYWPWIEVLKTAKERGQDMAAPAARIIDSLSGAASGQPGAAAGGPGQFKLGQDVAGYVAQLAATCPVLVVLEDMHWADQGSLFFFELLSSRVRQHRLTLLSTFRNEEHPSPHVVDALNQVPRHPRARILEVPPLDDAAIGKLVRLHATGHSSFADIPEITRLSGGNPLFAIEIVRAVPAGHDPSRPAPKLPVSVSSAVRQRIGRLTTPCVELMQLASVIGDDFEQDVLTCAAGLAEMGNLTVVRQLVDEASESGFVEAPRGPGGRLKFKHALIREVLVQSIGPARKARFHALVAQSIESHQASSPADPAVIAFHLDAAGAFGDSAKLLEYSLLAGHRAAAANATGAAIEHLGRSVRLMNGARGEPWARASHELGRAMLTEAYADPDKERAAFAHIRVAFDFYVGYGLPAKAVAVVVRHLPSRVWIVDEILQLTEDALPLVAVGSPEESHVRARRAYALAIGTRRDFDGAFKEFARADAIALERGDPSVAGRTLQGRILAENARFGWEASLRYSVEILNNREGKSDSIVSSGFTGATNALLTLGRTVEARACLSDFRAHASATNDPESVRGFQLALYNVGMLTGNGNEVSEAYEGGPANYHTRGIWTPDRFAHYQLLWGDPSEGFRLLDELGASYKTKGQDPIGPARTRWILARGAHISSRANYAQLAANIVIPESLPDVFNWSRSWLSAEGLVASFTGNREAARRVQDRLKRFTGEVDSGWWGHPCVIDGVLALVAQTCGDRRASYEYFNNGLDLCRRSGLQADRYLLSRDFAQALMKDPDNGLAASQLAALVEEANGVATEIRLNRAAIGLDALNKEFASFTAGGGAASQEELTGRELDVLCLMAEGLSNSQIAGRLVLSKHTVTEYVGKVLAKTGSANRAEAAAYAVRARLV